MCSTALATLAAPALAYLERYGETLELPIELKSEVKKVEFGADGRFGLELEGRTITADQVVVATGPFQTPYVPKLVEKLAGDVFQTHAVGYRRRTRSRRARSLWSVAATRLSDREGALGHTQGRALGSTRQKPLPQRVLGRDLFWWPTKARILEKTVDSRLGRKLSTRDTLIGSSPRELKKRYGVEVKPRVVGAEGRSMRFEDGSELEVDGVIWATGYRPDYAWIKLPIFDEDGRLGHRRGVTDASGLYFPWPHLAAHARLGADRLGQGRREFIAERIAEYQQSKAQPAAETPVGAGAPAQGRPPERM